MFPENHDTDAVVGPEQHRRQEAREDATFTDRPVTVRLAGFEAEAHAGHPRIGLVVGFEHGCDGLRFQH